MANLLTVLRMILAIIAIEFLFTGNPAFSFAAVFITLIVIVLDGLDGYVARKFNEQSTIYFWFSI